jgi:hypothetical protein
MAKNLIKIMKRIKKPESLRGLQKGKFQELSRLMIFKVLKSKEKKILKSMKRKRKKRQAQKTSAKKSKSGNTE